MIFARAIRPTIVRRNAGARPPTRARFFANCRGVAAVEFALVAAPFFALLFAICNAALMAFQVQQIELGVVQTARALFVGTSTDRTDAELRLCSYVAATDCRNLVTLDVESFAPDSFPSPLPPVDTLAPKFEVSTTAGDLVLVRAVWTISPVIPFVNFTSRNFIATQVFRVQVNP